MAFYQTNDFLEPFLGIYSYDFQGKLPRLEVTFRNPTYLKTVLRYIMKYSNPCFCVGSISSPHLKKR